MSTAITASTDTIAANTFGAVDPQPFVEQKARVVSSTDNQLTGFFNNEDRVNISNQAQQKALAEQQIQETANSNQAQNVNSTQDASQEDEQPSDEFIQVSSSLGRAASTGNLKRDEAMAIYQKIASLI